MLKKILFFGICFITTKNIKSDIFSSFGDLITGKADPAIVDIPNFRSTVTTCTSPERARVSALIYFKKDSLKTKADLRIKFGGESANKDFAAEEADALTDLYMQGNRMIHTSGELCSLKYGSAEDQKKYNDRCLITNYQGKAEQNEVARCDLVEPGAAFTISHSEILCVPKDADVARIAEDLKKAKTALTELKAKTDQQPKNLQLKERYSQLENFIGTLEHQWSGLATKVTQSNTSLCGNEVKERNACLLRDPKGNLTQLDPVPGSCKRIED